MNKNLLYITESVVPNTNAEIIHVLKICDAFASKGYNVTIFTPNAFDNYVNIKKNFNLKNEIKIKSAFKKIKKLNFFLRVIFFFKVKKHVINKNFNIILSRSILTSLFLSIYNFTSLLEIHHEMSGITRYIFNFIKTKKKIKNIKLILLHKNLIKILNPDNYLIKYKVLDDAVNYEEFQIKSDKIFEKTCVYTGSFYKGKGVEIIEKIASKTPEIKYHLYGDKKFLGKRDFPKNMFFFDYVTYDRVPLILSSYEVLLMPYNRIVKVRSNIKNVSNYMSPLKLFEYLACGKVILATDLKVYDHILKNDQNSYLFHENDIDSWANKILEIFQDTGKYSKLRANSIDTAKKYSWSNRAKEIELLALEN